MTWNLDSLIMQKHYTGPDGTTVLQVGLLSQDESNLIQKDWFDEVVVAREVSGEWYEIVTFKRISGPPCECRRLKEFYRDELKLAFTLADTLLMQMGKGHAILMRRWAEDFGYKFTPILGTMADREPIVDMTDNGGSDDEQVVLIENNHLGK